LWDISCDSDGEIPFDSKRPLYLHDIDLDKEDYFLGFFLLGAYQETLSMEHNLFTRPTEATICINDQGYTIDLVKPSKNILEILISLGYEEESLLNSLNNKINKSTLLTLAQKNVTIAELKGHLEQNGYLQISN
jgi:arginine decarboxylase